jgi:hypothetical protein
LLRGLFIIFTLSLLVWLASSLWRRAATSPSGVQSAPAGDAAHGIVAEAFLETLCRLPDGEERASWEGRGLDKAGLAGQLRSSPEGEKARTVRQVYLQTLARDPLGTDCAGLRTWVDRPLALDQVARYLAVSPEGQRVAQVRQIFIETLGRDPIGWDNASLRRWTEGRLTFVEIRERLAAQRPLVGVHYFPWYAPDRRGWGNGVTVVEADAPKPLLGWYASSDPAIIGKHIDQIESAGFDFVVVDLVAATPASWATARSFFAGLAGRNVKAAVMLDGLYTEAAEAKAAWVEKARAEFVGSPNYFSFHGTPLVLLFATPVNFAVDGVGLRNVYWTDRYGPGANTFNLHDVLYPHDWPFWAASPQPLVNGVVPVTPGYTDAHLGRATSMDHPRRGGEMYREQWLRALAMRPELILVYSWNEYFEKSAIEPTETWGDRYLRWTACYIAHAHRGSTGVCEPDLEPPPVTPTR